MKHLKYSDRLKIETLYKSNHSKKYIAEYLNVDISTIYRELKKGYYEKLNSDYTISILYSADIAQKKTDYNQTLKGCNLKLKNDYDFYNFVKDMVINKKYSPRAIVSYIKNTGIKFNTNVHWRTLYNYIYNGIIDIKKCEMVQPRKHKYKRLNKHNIKNPLALSIHDRPKIIENRKTFGHWEMDTVIDKNKNPNPLLVLTERKTRYELIFKMQDKTSQSTIKILNRLERLYKKDFSKIFKTITVDNGAEFAYTDGIQKSIYKNAKQRTIIYYCHPYSYFERGSNENQNKFIRRFFPKGKSFKNITNKQILELQNYINNYPRPMFNGETAQQRFNKYVHYDVFSSF